MEMQDFYTGRAFDAHTRFGAHPHQNGVTFCTWAPAARRVEVIGEWNGWQGEDLHPAESAVWQCDCPAAQKGMLYKLRITGADGSVVEHCDPYGFAMELRPGAASRIQGMRPGYAFSDDAWMAGRQKNFDAPLNIYEIHAGSWRQKAEPEPAAEGEELAPADDRWLSYAQLAEILPGYLVENGYTHVELMPLAEHPFDGSWGYQTTGFFAPTSRYGTPEELCALVDACHNAGVGVILDFVPVHFAVDAYGLKHFDGTALYEYPAAAVGESEWGSCNFMHSRGEIASFLQSCAAYWLDAFHLDGLRMDAVSRLIYWQGDPARGVNGNSLDFLKRMNAGLHKRFPTAMLIAEDSTNYPKVTAPVEYGGLGFDYKWDLGWMNDTLDYFKKTPAERRDNYGKLTFSMLYFYNEHYLLPFSHDENVHGKATILQKMYGSYEQKFPQGRALYLYMAVHPGKMLDFMGNEFGQLREWTEARGQDWLLRQYPLHDGYYHFRQELSALYRRYDAFWQGEYDPARFAWLDCDGAARCTCAMLRRGNATTVFAAFNFGDAPLKDHTLTLPAPARCTLLLDSDWQCFGGAAPRPAPAEKAPAKAVKAAKTASVTLTLAPFSGQLFEAAF